MIKFPQQNDIILLRLNHSVILFDEIITYKDILNNLKKISTNVPFFILKYLKILSIYRTIALFKIDDLSKLKLRKYNKKDSNENKIISRAILLKYFSLYNGINNTPILSITNIDKIINYLLNKFKFLDNKCEKIKMYKLYIRLNYIKSLRQYNISMFRYMFNMVFSKLIIKKHINDYLSEIDKTFYTKLYDYNDDSLQAKNIRQYKLNYIIDKFNVDLLYKNIKSVKGKLDLFLNQNIEAFLEDNDDCTYEYYIMSKSEKIKVKKPVGLKLNKSYDEICLQYKDNKVRKRMAEWWIRNAAIRIFSDKLRSIVEIIVNSCGAVRQVINIKVTAHYLIRN